MAEHRSPYIIKFSGLPLGEHEFIFDVGDSFFKDRETSIILGSQVEVKVKLVKGSGTMQVTMNMVGKVRVECMRCLEPFDMAVLVDKTLLIRRVEQISTEEDDDDTIFLAHSANELDLETHIYDFLTLQIPYSPVHPDSDSGKEVCSPIAKKIIISKDQTKNPSPENDRWAALRNIKLN